MKPTPEQEIAIDTQDRALVVEAGAGTGKTWVLVQRFIHLLETHPDWPLDSILAITFTEKAAREMRTRLRQAIENKAMRYPDDPHWRGHRLNLDRMQVSTIHSLCSRILRENAIAAEIDPHFQVLDEQEADLLKEEAVRETVQRLNEDNHPALELLVTLRVIDLRNEMEAMLAKRGTIHQLFLDLGGPEDLLRRWQAGLRRMRCELWKTQHKQNPSLSEVINTLPMIPIIDPEDLLSETMAHAQQGCLECVEGNIVDGMNQWLKINLRGGSQGNWGGKESLAGLKENLGILRDIAQVFEKAGALKDVDQSDVMAVKHLQLWRSLWEFLDQIYCQIKETKQALDFDDLEMLTDRLLKKMPISQRLQGFLDHVNHLMVDEFQDTNVVQQRIVYAIAPLCQRGKLFVVGDAKQSIYRFRQAQVSIFNQTAKEVRDVTGFLPVTLRTSFRTHHCLVNALNTLFDKLFTPLGEEYVAYEAHPGPLTAHRESHSDLSTPVEMILLPSERTCRVTMNAEETRNWEAQLIAQRIMKLRDTQFPVWDRDQRAYRPFEFKDAVVLFRATTQLPIYETQFKNHQLPYLTVSGRGYYDRPEVQDLISLLTALANPADDLSIAAALRSPLFSINDETLYTLRWHLPDGERSRDPIPLKRAISNPPITTQPALVERAAFIFSKLWTLTNRVEVWSLLRSALDLTSYEVTLSKSDGEIGRQYANVQKFMSLARDRGEINLSDFLHRLRDLKLREAREGEALGREPESGAVQLMSIHAAKGLEFPVVFLADLGRTKGGGSKSPYLLHDPAFGLVCKVRDEIGDWVVPSGYAWGKWLNEMMEEAENKRLLYVACTRAADLFILSGRAGNKNSWFTEIMDAWSISESGSIDDIHSHEDFSIRIFRPEEPVDLTQQVAETKKEEPPQVNIIPPLALPLELKPEIQPIAVTKLEKKLRKKTEAMAEFPPAIWVNELPKAKRPAPGFLVGNIVHKALAHWDCMEYPKTRLLKLLQIYARSEGVFPNALSDAVERSRQIIVHFRDHELYQAINQAAGRYHEVPFTVNAPTGIIHGIIDLLYKDRNDTWNLLDWKTERAPEARIEEIAHLYFTQMTIYAHAIHQTMGVHPKVGLCFIIPEVVYYQISEKELEKAWAEIGG